MTTELRIRHQSQQLYTRALTQAWRSGIQLYEPSLWLTRDPEVEEKMLRDADIASALGYRRALIAGRQWNLVPRQEGSERSPLALLVGTELLKAIRKFTEARNNLARAFFSGSRFAKIHGEPRVLRLGDGVARTWWVPVRLVDMDKRMFRIVRDEQKGSERTIRAHWERWSLEKEDWVTETVEDAATTIRHVYQDDEGTLGYGRALREALGWWWYAKQHVFQESLQAVERFAQGILAAKVDGIRDANSGLPNTELINSWKDVLEDLRARHVLVYDSADEVSHVQMNGEGWQLLKDIREELKATISTLILGSNLTTQATEGGSYALAEIQENSTESLIQYDRETLEETITDDLLGCVWFKNHANLHELGIADHKPRFSITQEKKLDPQVRATVAQTLHTMGVDIAASDLYEQTGFRKPEAGEEVIAGREEQPPMGGGFPGAVFQRTLPLNFDKPWEEEEHPRDKEGEFVPKGQGEPSGKEDESPEDEKPDKGKPKPKPKRTQNKPDNSPEYRQRLEQWKADLSESEKDAIHAWTQSGYSDIRGCQSGGGCSGKNKKLTADLEAAMQRAPNREGTYYRGIKVPKSFIDNLSAGSEMSTEAFSSWSGDKKVGQGFARVSWSTLQEGQVGVMFVGSMKTMKDVSSMSFFDKEQESVSMTGTRMRVTKIRKSQAINGFEVHVEEVAA